MTGDGSRSIYMEEPTYPTWGPKHPGRATKSAWIEKVGRKRVRRLMRVMGLEPIYPKPRRDARKVKQRC